MTALLRWAKNLIVPGGSAVHEVLFGPARGCRLDLDLHHEFGKFVGLYERELWRHARGWFESARVVFDVGAGNGFYSAIAIARGARVVAVEPDADECRRLRSAMGRYEGSVLTLVQAAVGGSPGQGVSLDMLAAVHGAPDLVKMDIEGAEGTALRTARGLLSGQRSVWLIETHGAEVERECVAILQGARYTVTVVERRTWLREHRPLDHNRWLVAVPHSQASRDPSAMKDHTTKTEK